MIQPVAPARPRHRVACALVAALLVTTGCAASTPAASSATRSPVAVSSGAVALRSLGLAHGPEYFWLPAGTVTTSRIDQPNVVTLTFDVAPGRSLARWLTGRLPAMGFTVDAARNDSIVFHDPAWQGGYTCSSTLCALTLRQQH